MSAQRHVVTGAFGFSGKYIARRLLEQGHEVHTLTNSPGRADPFGGRVRALPLALDDVDALAASLQGASVLYNTYWVRFNHRRFRHADAVSGTLALFDAARRAGVERVVHVSITNPDEHCGLEYFEGKALLERSLRESGLSHAILRPAVLFGREDILINNIAWTLRTFPAFFTFGHGSYRLRPIHVDDLAALAVREGAARANATIDAVGPESFTYRELAATIADAIGRTRPILPLPPRLLYRLSRVVGWIKRDEFVTWEEVRGLMAGLLDVDGPATGPTRLSAWARRHAGSLGRNYASELRRRRDRTCGYVGC
ncbi:MAG: SDR family oxidoreductase [Desulfovibrionaceae bacterium]